MKLNKELEKLLDAYYLEAPKEAAYPYKVFEVIRASEREGMQTYNLEVNVWDQHAHYSRAEALMDALEQKLHRCNHTTNEFFIRIFRGQRQNVTDPDKSIKRVREQFEMQVYLREEI